MNQYTEHSAAIAAPPQRRRRPALSCVQCRRRKIRCDQKRPSCSQCERSKDILCIYKPIPPSAALQNGAKLHEISQNTDPSFNTPEQIFHGNTSAPPTSVQASTDDVGRPRPSHSTIADRSVRVPGDPGLEDAQPFIDKIHGSGALWPFMVYLPEIERHIVPSSSIFTGSNLEKPSAFKMKLTGANHWMNLVTQVSLCSLVRPRVCLAN